jgi:hypothetical protein
MSDGTIILLFIVATVVVVGFLWFERARPSTNQAQAQVDQINPDVSGAQPPTMRYVASATPNNPVPYAGYSSMNHGSKQASATVAEDAQGTGLAFNPIAAGFVGKVVSAPPTAIRSNSAQPANGQETFLQIAQIPAPNSRSTQPRKSGSR